MDSAPAPMFMRIILDPKYEYSVIVRAQGFEICPLSRVFRKDSPSRTRKSTGPAKTVVVICRPVA